MQKTQSFSNYIKNFPFANRLIFVVLLTTWILDIPGITTQYLINKPGTLSPNYQLWRIFTASFSIQSLFDLIIVCINFYTFTPKLQQKTSSIWVLSNFFIIGAIIQFLYSFLLMFLPQSFVLYVAKGSVVGIWFNLVVKYCFFNDKTKIKMCCFGVKIGKMVYVFVLFGIWTILSFRIYFDAILGIVIAFLQCKFFKANLISCKSDLCLGFLSKFSSWVNAAEKSSNQSPFQDLQSLVPIPKWSQSTKQSKEDYFSNKKGVRLSDV